MQLKYKLSNVNMLAFYIYLYISQNMPPGLPYDDLCFKLANFFVLASGKYALANLPAEGGNTLKVTYMIRVSQQDGFRRK